MIKSFMATELNKTFLGLQQCQVVEWRVNQFPDDKERDGSWNIGLLAEQPPDAAASPRKFSWIIILSSQ